MADLDGHKTAERRSLAYHRRIAERLVEHPELRSRALQKVNAVLKARTTSSHADYAVAWKAWLEGPLEELIAFLAEDSQRARDHRQSSPFAGALSPRERWELWRENR